MHYARVGVPSWKTEISALRFCQILEFLHQTYHALDKHLETHSLTLCYQYIVQLQLLSSDLRRAFRLSCRLRASSAARRRTPIVLDAHDDKWKRSMSYPRNIHRVEKRITMMYFTLDVRGCMGAPLQAVARVARMLSLLFNKPIVGVNHCVGPKNFHKYAGGFACPRLNHR